MRYINKLGTYARGVVAGRLQRSAAKDIDNSIDELFECAVSGWAAEHWLRFNDHEVNCTVQLYKWCNQIKQTNPRMCLISIDLEYMILSPAIRSATQSAARMSRPDIRISIGGYAGRSVECKRLEAKSKLPGLYASKGMTRFVTGQYGAGERVGIMIGFVLNRNEPIIVKSINRAVIGNSGLGVGHTLTRLPATHIIPWQHTSTHLRSSDGPITLRHYLLDLR